MARIRSVHPGQWTDGEFLRLSPLGRLLALGIRNECDDQGVFPWSPIDLKIRLMPLDNVDMGKLLGELEACNQIRRFTSGGREYGAVRNFMKYQRPKKPTITHPLPDDLRGYVLPEKDSPGGTDGPSSGPSSEPRGRSNGSSSEQPTRSSGASSPVEGGLFGNSSAEGEEGRGEKRKGKEDHAPAGRASYRAVFDGDLGIDPKVAADFEAHRRAKKEPLSEGALKGLNRELRRIKEAGADPGAALGEAMLRGWTAVKADWILKPGPRGVVGSSGTPPRTSLDEHEAYARRLQEIRRRQQG